MKNLFVKKEKLNQFDEQRKTSNKQILSILNKYIKENPKQRFIQALWNLNIIDNTNGIITDRYNEEPDVTLEKIKEQLNKYK